MTPDQVAVALMTASQNGMYDTAKAIVEELSRADLEAAALHLSEEAYAGWYRQHRDNGCSPDEAFDRMDMTLEILGLEAAAD